MTSDDKRERQREDQRKWRLKNGPHKQEYMRKRRRRRAARLAEQPEGDHGPIETLGTVTPEAAQAQDAAFQAAMVAAGYELTGVSTKPGTVAPREMATPNHYRIVCK